VGPAQARALRAQARTGSVRVLQLRRPGLGNALVIPRRYELRSTRRGFYVRSQLRGILDAVRWWRAHSQRPDWRQFGELRMWLQAELRDRVSGRELVVITSHLSVEPSLKRRQGQVLVARARAAASRHPVILAGDFNVPAVDPRGRDVEIAKSFAAFEDVRPATLTDRPPIDYILTAGFEPVAVKAWTHDSLALPGSPDAKRVSDHYPIDATLRFAEA
jgi:endonuclease/exonuclease/phosphatase family metal-dependent hydrolase